MNTTTSLAVLATDHILIRPTVEALGDNGHAMW